MVLIHFWRKQCFPGENIVFGNRGQSNEQNNEALMKAYDLATQKKYKQALTLIEQNIEDLTKACDPSRNERLSFE